MTQHPSDTQLDAFIRHISPVEELVEIDRHVAGCAECRSRMRLRSDVAGSAAWLRREIGQALPEEHLAYDDVAALAEGRGLPAAANHVAACGRCRAEVDDLREFARASKPRRQLPLWAAAAAAIFVVALTPVIWKLSHRPGSLVAVLQDAGGTLGLDQNGNLHSSKALPAEYSGIVAESLRTGRIQVQGVAAGLGRDKEVLLGAAHPDNRFALKQPVAEAVLADRPVFRWTALEGASGYRVNVYDEQFRKVAASPVLSELAWTPGEALPRDHVYSWTVTARVGNEDVREPVPPAPEAKFAVLSEQEVDRLRSAAAMCPDAHLLLAALYARAGAIEEARVQLKALETANPGSALAQRLQTSLSPSETLLK